MDICQSYHNTYLRLGFVTAFLSIILSLCGCDATPSSVYQGYVESDFVYISPEATGRLVTLWVNRGDIIKAGQKLGELDDEVQRRQRAIEEENLQAAEATLDDLHKGRRKQELNITDARIAQARQEASIAASRLARYKKMHPNGYISDFEFQQAQTESRQKRERVNELLSQRETDALPSRQDQILAQQARVSAAREMLALSQIALDKRTLTAVSSAMVYDVIAHVGEVVTPGQPVFTLMPDDAVKVRFFVPNRQLPNLTLGQTVSVKLEGSGASISSQIVFISPKAEYTPPVIYTQGQRERMMFMIEALPRQYSPALKPGLPVEVHL